MCDGSIIISPFHKVPIAFDMCEQFTACHNELELAPSIMPIDGNDFQ